MSITLIKDLLYALLTKLCVSAECAGVLHSAGDPAAPDPSMSPAADSSVRCLTCPFFSCDILHLRTEPESVMLCKFLITPCYLHRLPGDPDCVLPGKLLGEREDVCHLVTAHTMGPLLAATHVASQAHSVSLQ